jgi:hypothetical protein
MPLLFSFRSHNIDMKTRIIKDKNIKIYQQFFNQITDFVDTI